MMGCATLHILITFTFRLASGDRVPPFFQVFLCATSVIFSSYSYRIPFFKHVDKRDNRVEYYGIGPWMKFPKSMRHDVKLKKETDRLGGLTDTIYLFTFLYPVLGGVFFQALDGLSSLRW